jgi:hypothetical protein
VTHADLHAHDAPSGSSLNSTTPHRHHIKRVDRPTHRFQCGHSLSVVIIERKRPRYVRGSASKTVRVGRVGPGGEYAGIHAGVKLRSRKRGAEYYVGVSAGRRISTPY